METGKYPASTVLGTYPYLSAGGVRFHEWNKAGFGPMGYVGALQWSSNTFFGQVGRGIGGENLIKWSRAFGFGEKSGIEIHEERAGLIADNEWKMERFDREWAVGDTINMSIGQGFTLANTVQVARMFAVIANDGYLIRPHLQVESKEMALGERKSLNIKQENIDVVKRGLRAVVSSGTGTKAQSGGIPPVAGKSGTAEAPPGRSHTWFGGYAPYNKPEIVVVAFAEHSGGGGGSITAPMTRELMEAYFSNKRASKETEKK
jgi:penicillin-binding protein 2